MLHKNRRALVAVSFIFTRVTRKNKYDILLAPFAERGRGRHRSVVVGEMGDMGCGSDAGGAEELLLRCDIVVQRGVHDAR